MRHRFRILTAAALAPFTTVIVTWLLVWRSSPPSYSERILVVAAPPASTSPVRELQLSRCESWCGTWWSLTGYSLPGTALDELVCDDAPADLCRPFRPEQLHAALDDPTAWPRAASCADRQLALVWSHGWPFRCLYYRVRYDGVTPLGYEEAGALAVHGLRPRFNEMGLWVVLPYAPHWPGFLADTAIFGAAWLGFFYGSSMLISASRRARRRRRGRCPECGYNHAGTPEGSPCPECGGESSRAS